ncbi:MULTISPECIES: hypothetical protein [unclassified Endozoicomonas]|uniref:hypothetical protein n=1 Tax=unclassified Endozoicomonas TaxID=2644528 RepID=UPI003BB585CB
MRFNHYAKAGVLSVDVARHAFMDRPGLLALIRHVAGGFFYSMDEIVLMEHQIKDAAMAGADAMETSAL